MSPGHTPARAPSRTRAEAEEFVPAPRPAGGPSDSGGARREPEPKLTNLEQRILGFESQWWRASGAKTQAIADELELTPEQYYQHLARLIDHPEAAAEQPAVIRRLRAARAERSRR
uniref:DUF3263 domain-containing protein n=1 Tax=Glycomyces xiaoerkulensis TaxID=2038139 RepID=UPI000C258D06